MKKTLSISLLLFVTFICAAAQPKVKFQRTEDVIYGRKHGTALTLDVFKPEKPNGVGIIFLLSGGWVSLRENHDRPPFHQLYPGLIDAGYTVFTVVHGSNPKFTIPEIVPDIHRAVRFVRSNAKKYGVDPDRLGLMGASAGGHLTLSIGTQGDLGNPNATDPIEQVSSRVQAAVALFPPTDFLNYGKPGEDAVGVGTLKNFRSAFGITNDTAEARQALGKKISPINFLTKELPPTLLIHGDADLLVPYQQSTLFVEKAKTVGATVELINRPKMAHGWPDYSEDVKASVTWFDSHLLKK